VASKKPKRPIPDRPLLKLAGVVRLARVNEGTGSAHTGAVLQGDGGETVPIVRIDANPFDDEDTRALAGRHVVVEGYRVGGQFRFLRVLPDAEPD
jgi:hypothetical protein